MRERMHAKARVGEQASKYETALQRPGEVSCFVFVVLR